MRKRTFAELLAMMEFDQGRQRSPMQAALLALRRCAKAPDTAPVFFAHDEHAAPRKQRKWRTFTHTNGINHRVACWRVIVGREWIRKNFPEVFATFAAARITGNGADLIPAMAQGGSQWQLT